MIPVLRFFIFYVMLPLLFVLSIYIGLWGTAFYQAKSHVTKTSKDLQEHNYKISFAPIRISGFPGKLEADISNVEITHPVSKLSLKIPDTKISFWPLPGRHADIFIREAIIQDKNDSINIVKVSKIQARTKLPMVYFLKPETLHIQSRITSIDLHKSVQQTFDPRAYEIKTDFVISNTSQSLRIHNISFRWQDMLITTNGDVLFTDTASPEADMQITFLNYTNALDILRASVDLPVKAKMGLSALSLLATNNNGYPELSMPLSLRENTIRLGAFDLATLPQLSGSSSAE